MNANEDFRVIMALDLDPIKVKLMHVPSGEGWSLDKANAVEKEYRRFLYLMKTYPDEATAPLEDVDTFWHYHILDTMKYARDCEQVFGYFLHHYPYVGLRGEDDEQFRIDSGERMRTLYEATFGEAYPAMSADGPQADAFCAGPTIGTAFCAGPTIRPAIATGPAGGIAFCAGPTIKPAFCAGPTIKPAFCAGPTIKTAFCAGPTIRMDARTDDSGIKRAARSATA